MRHKMFAAIMVGYLLSSTAFASTDSAKITGIKGLKQAQANIVTVSDKCYTTNEKRYSVSSLTRESAYPKCPANYVVQKVNLKTEQFLSDVWTKISVECCPQKTSWQQVASNQ